MLKESWEASTKISESVVSYVLCIQERLAKLRDLVKENLENAQQTQKSWYDRHARERELQPGEQVLVLLPTSTNKLLAEWQGPYPITKRVSKVDYEIQMSDRRRQKRVFHINMLHKWHSLTAVSFLAEEVPDDVVTWNDPGDDEAPQTGEHLSPAQTKEMQGVLD